MKVGVQTGHELLPHRVLYVDTAPTVGGSVISLHELLRGLDRSLYQPVVCSFTQHSYVDRYRALGAKVVVLGARVGQEHRPRWVRQARESQTLRLLRQTELGMRCFHALGFCALLVRRTLPVARVLRKLIREERIQLVHTNIRVGHDREGILAAKLAGVPCVAHVRDFENLNWFDRRLAGAVDAFVYISQAVRQCHLVAGVPVTKGRVVYNAVDTLAFSESLVTPHGREALGVGPHELVVGLVGRLEPWKGQEVFLKAMALVVQEIPRVKALIIGDPVPYEPAYPAKLRQQARELGLVASVGFHPFRPDAAAAMSALDLVVLASTSAEPFGRVLIEAMALGKPVVATDAGAVPEIMEDGIQGLLVQPGKEEALAEAIIRILTHREEATLMGKRGRATVEERFGLERYVRDVESLYGELLA